MNTSMKSAFAGTQLGAPANGSRVNMLFKRAEKAAKKAAPSTQTIKRAPQKAKKQVKKAVKSAPVPSRKPGSRSGGKGATNEGLWLPNTTRPAWLDGSLPGDRGFDPLGLSKPTEYLQVDIDELDQNKAVNKAGNIIGKFNPVADAVSTDSLQPYSEVFGLNRFRETELIHGRWAMLATLGVIVAEATTGVAWQDAGKVELDGASYLGLGLPFTVTQLTIIEVILVGGAEIYRNTEQNIQKRQYPGGVFDPLGLASGSDERAFNLKTAELKHGRLAMIAFLGFGVQAFAQGEGALGSLAKFATSFDAGEKLVEAVEGAVENAIQ
jgi:light-harvesting complex II chlorophyll a/b binding protein 4